MKDNENWLPKIESMPLENRTWKERRQRLDKISQTLSSKVSHPVNTLEDDNIAKDEISNIYPMTIKLTDYGIG